MDNLFTRNLTTAESTASLFTDEKTAAARARVVEWLNEAPVSGSTTVAKNEMINKVQEVLLRTDPELLEEFIDDVLVYSQDTQQDVRRTVVAFIEETCKLHVSFMPRCIITLASLLRDSAAQVAKRAIQACGAVYKHTLQWLVGLADISDATEHAWTTLCTLKAEILDKIDDDNDGIRTNAIKFLEGVVILQTYPDEDSVKRAGTDFSLEQIPISMKIIKRRMLEDEANKIFDSLLQFHAASHISSVNLIACTGTLCIIARMRPSFMPTVVEALKQLLNNLPPTLTDSQVVAVRKHLKMQLLNMLKNHASYEQHSQITPMLGELGASNGEIARAMPKMDKHEQHRRAKRALENATAAAMAAKRQRLDAEKRGAAQAQVASKRQLEIDYDEVEEQVRRATQLNETFLAEQLQSLEACVDLVIASMPKLADTASAHFLRTYAPANLTVAQTIGKIAATLAPLLTENRMGPGVAVITKEPPMRLKVSAEEEKNIIQGRKNQAAAEAAAADEAAMDEGGGGGGDGAGEAAEPETAAASDDPADPDAARKDEATKRLRENMERAKSGADPGADAAAGSAVPKMKQRAAKSLKLSEVTKPLSRATKEKFLLDAVGRVLRSERKSVASGAVCKRRKILTVLASTFTANVRDSIIAFIRDDLRGRLDLAFSWLYEEYSLLQGFTRHSYIKSEQKPDYAYNRLLGELIAHCVHSEADATLDRPGLLRRIYTQAPIISDEAVRQLVALCEQRSWAPAAMQLVRDLAVSRPPKKLQFLDVLLRFAMHEDVELREHAIRSVIVLYSQHKIQVNQIEAHALLWLGFLEQNTPPGNIFTAAYGRAEQAADWSEPLAKTCIALFLALLPYRPSLVRDLAEIYVASSNDMKRTILRSLEPAVKAMGAGNEDLLQLIGDCPKGAETMLTRILYVLTDGGDLNAQLVRCVCDVYQQRVADVRLLVPILNGLSRAEVIAALPRLLKISEPVLKDAFARLLGTGKHAGLKQLAMSPVDLLVALHQMDTTKVELKLVVKATAMCLAEREAYPQDVLAQVLQQLVDAAQLPTLLMRTVLQSLSIHPRLAGFVVQLLQRLVNRQVWRIKVLWEGFLKCAQRLRPHSLLVLLSLPPEQLKQALNACPELRPAMVERAEEIAQMQGGSVSKVTMDVLLGRSQDVYITGVQGMPEYGVVMPSSRQPLIKQEPVDVEAQQQQPQPQQQQHLYGGVGYQPLPPGEE